MKAILLGAGYATRLYPLTKDKAKPLLEVAGKTITDHIVEKIVQVPEVDEIIIVTNNKFAYQFEEWVNQANYDMKFTVVNDGTLSNDTRLGAIGDIQFVIEQENITDDLMILAGDNLFEFSLADFAKFAKEKESDALAMYEEDNLTQLQRSGVAEIDLESKLIKSFEEKPKVPKSNLSVPVFYVLKASSIPLIQAYLNEGYNPDAPGNFIPYLISNKDTYAYVFEGKRYDIGTLESYESVQKIFKNK
ncbi:nucleotidyltransferase family protein [Aerococcus viridans]